MGYMIDVRRLRVLRAVSHYGTVTAAAAALHFTPSAASQQIRQLGRELGVVLLEPHGRRVRLTPAAHGLLAHADAIQEQWDRAEAELRAGDEAPVGLLRACGFPVAVGRLLAPMAAALHSRHPRLTVRLQDTDLRSGFDQLFDGDADLAVVEATPGDPPPTDARFDQRPLMDDIFDLALPSGHRFAGRSRIGLAEVSGEAWVVPHPSSTCHMHTMSACGAAGFTPDVTHHTLDWNAIASLVGHGLGVALLPRLAQLPPGLGVVRVPCVGNPRRRLLTCVRAGSGERPGVTAALAELRLVAAEIEPGP